MIENTKVCDECGKDMPTEMHVCPECGAGRPRTRREKQANKRRFEPRASQVGALTEALREVPLPPAERRRDTRVRRKHRFSDSVTAPTPDVEPVQEDEQEGPSNQPSRGPAGERVTTEIRPAAESSGAPGVIVKRVARRKVYRYGETKKPKFEYGTELRIIIGVVAMGLLLLLMCRIGVVTPAPLSTGPEFNAHLNVASPTARAAPTLDPLHSPATRGACAARAVSHPAARPLPHPMPGIQPPGGIRP